MGVQDSFFYSKWLVNVWRVDVFACDAKLVGGIHDVNKLSIPGIGGNFIGGVVPGNIGGGYIGVVPSYLVIGGVYLGGAIPGIGGSGFPNIGGGFQGQAFQNALGRCLRCCSIST